jgi:hypothetical protein
MGIKQAIEDLEKYPPVATGNMRWHRPERGNDTDIILEQEWSTAHDDGKTHSVYWAPVPTVLED